MNYIAESTELRENKKWAPWRELSEEDQKRFFHYRSIRRRIRVHSDYDIYTMMGRPDLAQKLVEIPQSLQYEKEKVA